MVDQTASNAVVQIYHDLMLRLDVFLLWLSSLTLGQVWKSVNYHPLPPYVDRAVLVIVLLTRVPSLLRWWSNRAASRKVVSFEWPVPPEADPSWKGKVIESPHLFSHKDQKSLLPPKAGKTGSKRDYLTCFDPSTGYHLTTLPLLSAQEIAEQIQRAQDTQSTWAKTTFAQRLSFLRSLKAWVLRDMEGIVRVACRDTGKTKVDAVFGEILTTLSKLEWCVPAISNANGRLINYGEKTISPQTRPTNFLLLHKVSKVHYQPLGPTLSCVSWNYSFHNLISPLLASLFAGNVSIVKCSEQVAWSSMWFFGGIRACLAACGLPQDAVQLVICLPEVAETVTRNPSIKHITFIGSEPVGRKVAVAAADIMVPTCIELGGKDPAFLLPSADINFFGSTCLRGAFQSAGQNCIGIELFLVPRNLYQPFLDLVTPRVQALRVGTDVGSLFSATPIQKLTNLLANAEKQGARVLAGGKQFHHPEYPNGAYFEPTLVVDVTMDMEIAKTELFAPVMTVVPYDNVDEAVEWLSKSRFGLGSGVYGRDRAECRRVADKLECGMVAINDFGVFYLNQAMPFGGVKASGHGRFGGEEGLRGLCSAKAITEDRFFSLIKTPIPRAVADKTSWGFLRGLVNIAYNPSWLASLGGLFELILNAGG